MNKSAICKECGYNNYLDEFRKLKIEHEQLLSKYNALLNPDILHQLELPYPLSVNRYWRATPKGMLISADGRKFKSEVKARYAYRQKLIKHDVALRIIIHPKLTLKGQAHKTIIDIDNGLKSILDSLINVIYFDDKQVKKIAISYGQPVVNGGTTVEVMNV